MQTEDLIKKLSTNLPPVRVLPRAEFRFLAWFVASIAVVGALVGFVGVRSDIGEASHNVFFWAEVLLGVGVVVSAALSAFFLSVPADERPWLSVGIPMLMVSLWVGFVGYDLSVHGTVGLAAVLQQNGCVRWLLTLSVIPGGMIFHMIRKASPLQPLVAGAFSLLAAGGLAAVGVQLICKGNDALHILNMHILPVLLLTFVGMGVGSLVYRLRK